MRRASRRACPLADRRYISRITFRRDGSPVSTPVWVVSDDGSRLLVWTGAKTWKVRRVRRNARVLVAPCDLRGRETGDRISGHAHVLEHDAEPIVVELLRHKYGWQKRALEVFERLRRKRRAAAAMVVIEVRLSDDAPSRTTPAVTMPAAP